MAVFLCLLNGAGRLGGGAELGGFVRLSSRDWDVSMIIMMMMMTMMMVMITGRSEEGDWEGGWLRGC